MTERADIQHKAKIVRLDLRDNMAHAQQLIGELRYLTACERDTQLTDAELVASLDARQWWEDRTRDGGDK